MELSLIHILSDKIAHQHVGHIVIDQRHCYTNRYYSKVNQIASLILRGYIPRISTRAVSYTHLDVYKRQRLGNAAINGSTNKEISVISGASVFVAKSAASSL